MSDHQAYLSNLLHDHTSQDEYQDEDDLEFKRQMESVDDQYLDKFDGDEDLIGQDIDMGNSQSVDGDYWAQKDEDNKNNQNSQENEHYTQQRLKFCFREVVGNSQQFSQSISIHRPDMLESRSIHDNSLNYNNINLGSILNNKKREEEKVNQVLELELGEFEQERQKNKILIQSYQQEISRLTDEKNELMEENKHYLETMQKKDHTFSLLKESYKNNTKHVEEMEDRLAQANEKISSMEQEIKKLVDTIRIYKEQDRNFGDYRKDRSPARIDRSPARPHRDFQEMEELQTLKRESMRLKTENNELRALHLEKKQIEEELRSKISSRDKKINELSKAMEELREKKGKELNKVIEESRLEQKKVSRVHENSTLHLQSRISKLEKEISDKDDRLKQIERSAKYSIEDIRKKEQKIKELLLEVQHKNKTKNELIDQLKQEEAKNSIEEKIQKEREKQIDKLDSEIKQLRGENLNLRRQVELSEKPSSIENKLRREIDELRTSNQQLELDKRELSEELDHLEKQANEKNEKIKEMKKKYDEVGKKLNSTKKIVSESDTNKEKQIIECRERISKLAKENGQLRQKVDSYQEKVNKLYILESRLQHTEADHEYENHYSEEEQIEALQEELELKDQEIQSLKEGHLMEITRLSEEIRILDKNLEEKDTEFYFKEKELDYLHQKMIASEREKTELRASKNILHSSFYDESVVDESTVKFMQRKIASLQSTIRELENIIERQREDLQSNGTSKFEIKKLKSQIKELTNMLLANQTRKLVPESLSQEQTIQFVEKTMRKILHSSDMIRLLSQIPHFRETVYSLLKILDRRDR